MKRSDGISANKFTFKSRVSRSLSENNLILHKINIDHSGIFLWASFCGIQSRFCVQFLSSLIFGSFFCLILFYLLHSSIGYLLSKIEWNLSVSNFSRSFCETRRWGQSGLIGAIKSGCLFFIQPETSSSANPKLPKLQISKRRHISRVSILPCEKKRIKLSIWPHRKFVFINLF